MARTLFFASTLAIASSCGWCAPAAASEQPQVAPDQQSEVKPQEEAIVVTGRREDGYAVSSTDALGLPIAVSELPASVSILSDDLLEDLGARNLGLALPYVPGVANGDNGGVNRDIFVIRGFQNDNRYVNGIRSSITAEGRPALDTIERVEIVKGPSGVEGSLTAPGGFVNIITKKPQYEFGGEIFGSVGDFNFLRGGIDVTGALIGDTVAARLIASYEDKQQFRLGRRNRPIITIAPSVNVRLGSKTNLLVEYEYRDQNDPLDRGTIFARGILPDSDFLPREFSFHQRFDELKLQNHRIDADLTHRFNDILSVRLHYQSIWQNDEQIAVRNASSEGSDGVIQGPDGLTFSGNTLLPTFLSDSGSELRSEIWVGEAKLAFATGSVEHAVNLGGSTARNTDRFGSRNGDFLYLDGTAVIDVFAPNDQLTIADFSPETIVFSDFVRGDRIDSVYAQWLARWSDRFRTVASIRYDDISFFAREDIEGISDAALAQGVADGTLFPDELFSETSGDAAISWRLGASYDVTETLTAFIGAARTGEPQTGFTRSGDAVGLRSNQSFEIGLKQQLSEGRALATLTAYRIEQSNIAIGDPTNDADENFLVPLGAARVQGIELELSGKVSDALSLFGGASLQDSRISESDQPIIGNAFPNTPDFQASLFTNLNGAPFGLAALDIGAGVLYQGEREANSGNEYQLPGYARVDLGISYGFAAGFEARFQVNNLFDKTYYTAAQDSIFGADQVAVGDRRLIQLTVTKRF
ncbi:TonB-dependent siderophore receptor [Leptolyngbya sp. AN03gr2]|uniref:TonB-dependent siderophore receptor n=1 Tax=Leptolyngbya sp. AN03gr2 TaxID=3423364 RepID=UPI003D313C1F